MSDMPLAFELDEVCYAYPDQPALAGLSLKIRQGQRVALLGANGSGKSTLLRLLDGLYFAQRGSLRAFGQVLSEDSLADEATNFAFRKRVGFVFQNPDVQLFNPTVFDELAFGPLQLRWPEAEIRRAIAEVAARFGLEPLLQRAPHRLSGGEKKRVALASVMITAPEVLLLDEPTASLDPQSQGEIIRFLVAARHSGQTIVVATHDLHLVADIADHVCVLQAGRLEAEGSPPAILADTALLHRCQLAHAHWHTHADGALHTHAHSHGHAHAHPQPGAANTRYRPLPR